MCDHVQVCVVVCDYLSTVDVGWDGKITLKGDGWNPKKDHHRRKGFSDVACCDKPEPEYARASMSLQAFLKAQDHVQCRCI